MLRGFFQTIENIEREFYKQPGSFRSCTWWLFAAMYMNKIPDVTFIWRFRAREKMGARSHAFFRLDVLHAAVAVLRRGGN